MIAVLASLALLSTPFQEQQTPVLATDRPFVHLVFLVTGPNKDELSNEDRAKRTSAHLTGLRKMIEAGRAYAAGPILAGGTREGLAITNAGTVDEAKSLFAGDPWIEIGKLTPEVHKWLVPMKRFGKAGEVTQLNTHAFATVSVPNGGAADKARDEAMIKRMNANPEVAVAGLMEEGDTLRAVIIFKDKDKTIAAQALEEDPDIHNDKYKVVLSQTYIQQGVLD